MRKVTKKEKPPEQTAHPSQPLVWDGRIIRFKSNAIVRVLLDAGPFDMNQLAVMNFSQEDRAHLAHLIGYSVSGWGELSYVSEEHLAEADQAAEDFART